MTRAYLKFTDEPEWIAARDAHLHLDGMPAPGVEIDIIGTIHHEGVPVPGYHANVIVRDEFPVALYPACVNPIEPKRVWLGSFVLAMLEMLPEINETRMVERSIGASVPDDHLARIEMEVLRGRLGIEDSAYRIALIEANLAIAEKRASFGEVRENLDKAVEAVRTAKADKMDDATAKRDAAAVAFDKGVTEVESLRAARDVLQAL